MCSVPSSCCILPVGTLTDTLNEPKVNMSSNEVYVASGDVGQTENNEYCTIPEQTDNEYDYIDNR